MPRDSGGQVAVTETVEEPGDDGAEIGWRVVEL
jgi:hypothetical protein